MNFTQFNKNGGVEGFCLIKTVDRKMTAKGVPSNLAFSLPKL